jgi:thioredoxin-related protein
MDKRILLFGTDRCKFCKFQINFLKNAFKNKEWMYLDLEKDKDKGVWDIVEKLNVEEIPTLIILNKKSEELGRREGTMGADQILSIMHGGKVLPIDHQSKTDVVSGKRKFCLLSFEPESIKVGQKVNTIDFNGKRIAPVIIEGIKKVKINHIKKQYEKIAESYLKIGGTEDWAYMITFTKE